MGEWPVLIWPQLVATAMSAMVASSVSPERCKRTAEYSAHLMPVGCGGNILPMSEQPETRRQYLQLDSVDPESGKPIKVQISHERLMAVIQRGMAQAKEACHIVPHVLQKPQAIFEGLTQDEDEDRRGVGWRCYCGIPPHSYRTDGTECPPYPGQVYLVFVNRDGVAYNWRWEKADPTSPALPIDHEIRFKRRRL